MIDINGWQFPETPEEAKHWRPYHEMFPLHTNVLAVANTRIERAWCAYCRDVPGNDHYEEQLEVLRSGNKLPEDVARALFPRFIDLPYAN